MPDPDIDVFKYINHLISTTAEVDIHSLNLLIPGGASGNEPTCQCRRHKRHGFHP